MSGGVIKFEMPPEECTCCCHTTCLSDPGCCQCRFIWQEKHRQRPVPRIEGTEYIVQKKSDYNTADIKEKRREI